ncbi:MAG TPA: Zn-dependent hydrolase [Gaiellaceae bacterium]|jgi:acetylornithine deacetylase/succinyl-diaminopimelate desuccinylase-like protein|nr:Zn-dependent hydrolase [Gaiellaceae bacterium]
MLSATVNTRLDDVFQIGDGVGANRVGGTPEEDRACELAVSWMEDGGLEVEVDGRGNVVGRLRGSRPELPEVWTGSHLDSVPSGGRFDGALGVVAGLEAVASVGPSERTLGVVVFRDEETGCHGSRWRVRHAPLPGAFVELHVEQGPRLADVGAPLGVVTSIAGIVRCSREFEGRADHAGTTPMDVRSDALVAAAHYVLRLRDVAAGIEGAVATVGQLQVEPGAANVIPERVRLMVDARAPDQERLDRLAAELGLEGAHYVIPPVQLSPAVLRDEVERRGLPIVLLPSGAGHDAGVLAAAGVESSMLFVRSMNGGASHSPEEHSSDEDVALAVDVLTGALRRLAQPK